ncbi:MAG: hypothetical protein R2873_13600 [Caldilineaceae bacterium]
MDNALGQLFEIFVSQFPVLIAFGVGLTLAARNRVALPAASGKTTLAIVLFVIDLVVLNWLTQVVINSMVQADPSLSSDELGLLLNGLALARSVLRAWAFMILFNLIFPGAQGRRWPRRLLGGLVGLVIGVVLALALGGPISAAVGISDFEGASGYFVVFALTPFFALIGAVTGVVVTR